MKIPPELVVVMPVYNEQASVRKVVCEWFYELENWTENFVFVALDDGSTDTTPKILQRLHEQLGERFETISRTNRGHGQTCLEGYRLACERDIPFVFQIDSDGQCDPQYFFRLWRMRNDFDVIYGRRVRRDDGFRRTVATILLRAVLLFVCNANCVDANVPYRLIRTSVLLDALQKVPPAFFLANVALAVILRRTSGIRHGSVPIRFRERYGGEPSVPLSQFGVRAWELIAQLRQVS